MGYTWGVDSPHLTKYEQISKTMILWIENHEIMDFILWILIYINQCSDNANWKLFLYSGFTLRQSLLVCG